LIFQFRKAIPLDLRRDLEKQKALIPFAHLSQPKCLTRTKLRGRAFA
jgi:hypothetical protein